MKETTNYNLKLPELTDYIDVSDFNHNFTVIDREIIQKLNLSTLTFEKDGSTYVAKLAMIDNRPKLIGVDVGTVITDSGVEYTRPTDATETTLGRVKVSKATGENAPFTVPTIGRFEEDMSAFEDRISADIQSFKDTTESENNALKEDLVAHKEDYATQRQQDQLKIATVEKELNDYKSTMANINVNQEAKQKVSGYGTISLPKNAANGQVGVSLKGRTATNLIKNGDFKDGSSNWDSYEVYNAIKFVDGKVVFNGESSGAGGYFQDVNSANDILYFSITAHISGEDSVNLTLADGGSFGNLEYNRLKTGANSFIKQRTNGFRVYLQQSVGRVYTDNWLDDIMCINLTKTFGAGNEPSKEECDEMFKDYFEGTKSTISASRLKSVGKDGIQESTSYLPNVGELRSLPNGVRDEIKVSGGKAELVKRVSDTMEELAEPITTPIEVSGTLLSYPSGTVYVEKVLPVAGIYTDEIAIAHTDFPISSLDKISKVDFATGVETQLDVSKAVVATDNLSFTHTDLTSGDIVFFEYFYANESTLGELELEYYDSRHVLKDSVTGKFYKIVQTVADGVLTDTLVEV